ncbi:MAG: aKG-HExxH-type peptide beta-hydroxylase [Advenella sp.]
MLLQTDLDTQVRNIMGMIALSDLDLARNTNDFLTLGKAYRNIISSLQQRPTSDQISTNIIFGFEESRIFSSYLTKDALSLLDDKKQNNVIEDTLDFEAEEKAVLIDKALNLLNILDYEYSQLFKTLVTDIFIMPSGCARGGTTSAAVGIIWANPRCYYKVAEVLEFLIHEMTHNALFIDEQFHQHYNYDEILKKSNWAISAILKTPRPLDKVIHSIIVATEVVLFRDKLLGHPERPLVHPPTNMLIDQALISIDSVKTIISTSNFKALISPRVNYLLQNAEEKLSKIKRLN